MRTCCLVFLLATFVSAQTFTIQKSNTTENLRGLSAVSDQIMWASGTHGTYLRTTDGGINWHAAQVPGAEQFDFRAAEAFSADLAYLLSAGPGDQSRIYKTTNGGQSWILQFTNKDPNGFYDCMAFWDRDHGIAVGDPVNGKFELMATADGGRNWKPIPPDVLPPAVDGEGAFAASGTCIVVQGKTNVWFATGGKAARVFRSTDAGKSWTVAETPIIHGADSSGIFSIAFLDARHGVIAGGDYKQPQQDGPNLAYSNDGGITWKLAPVSPQSYFSAVALSTSRAGTDAPVRPVERSSAIFVVGSAHAAWASDITTKSWSKIWDLNLNAAALSAPDKAIAVGPKGLIVVFTMPAANR
jgi:photosystem II stability/assembly factor-like uncharacterized protein